MFRQIRSLWYLLTHADDILIDINILNADLDIRCGDCLEANEEIATLETDEDFQRVFE